MKRAHKFLKNVSFSLLSRIWHVLLALFLSPYIVRKLGVEMYGVLTIIGTISGYFALANFGMTNTLVKFISEYKAKKKYEVIKNLISTGFSFYLLIGIVGAILIIFIIPIIAEIVFIIPKGYNAIFSQALQLSGVSFFLTMVINFFISVIKGFQRFEFLIIKSVVFYTIYQVGVVILLWFGFGIIEIVFLQILTSILTLISYFFIIKIVNDGLKICPKFHKDTFLKLFNFSKW